MRLHILRCLLTTLLLGPAGALMAGAQCGDVSLSAAEESYDIGRLSSAVMRLRQCINAQGFNDDEKAQAYTIMARAYLAMDSVAQADDCIGQLLLLKDAYEPAATDANRFRLRVYYLRSKLRAGYISSVSKKAERIELAPATIQIITEEDIRNRGYQDLEAIFSDLPGFDVTRSYGLVYSLPYQRGYRASAGLDRTIFMVDGVEETELWTNSAYLGKQYSISNIKRVEIIYGPASTLYGPNAFTGVINLVTKGREDYFPDNEADAGMQKFKFFTQFNTGVSSYKTQFYDLTVGAKHRDLFMSFTARYYHTLGDDLGRYPAWDGVVDFPTATYQKKLTTSYATASQQKFDSVLAFYQQKDPAGRYYTADTGTRTIRPTAAAIALADSLDKAYYTSGKNGHSAYANQKRELYLQTQFSIGDLRLAAGYIDRYEGSSSDYVDNYAAVNGLTNWPMKQYFTSASYNKNISSKLSLHTLTYYRYSQYGPDASITRYFNYGNTGAGNLGLDSLLTGAHPYLSSDYYLTQCSQFRVEVRANYLINKNFDLLGGLEYRNSSLQGNYVTDTANTEFRTGVINQLLPGGNNFYSHNTGAFAELNYQSRKFPLNISAGGRFDYNELRETQGYGGVFNPRLSVVYYPGDFVYKLIYSQAFVDASAYNKFATSSVRLLNNPSLTPEKVKNIEGSVHYGLATNLSVEVAAYYSWYSNMLGTGTVTLPDGTVTTQFQAVGSARIKGLQASAQFRAGRRLSGYANFTYTDPEVILKSKSGADSSTRIGDISRASANAGVNFSTWHDKLLLHLRTNIVGRKETGATTTVYTNPLSYIAGYVLFNTAITVHPLPWLRAQVFCDNILNQYYESPGVRSADGLVYSSAVPQPGRTFGLSLIFTPNEKH